MLYLIPTPIGNLKDITLRAIETLQMVDSIICEDTRRTTILLNHYNIKKPLLVLNDYNESKTYLQIIQKLIQGQNLALVSDAGTPLVSDPGYKLVRECLKNSIEVDSLPGPSAAITALTLSALPPNNYLFLGYPPEKPGQRQKFYQNIQKISQVIPTTFIFYIAPFKLLKPLEEMLEVFGDIDICIASELTKIHQQVSLKSLQNWITDLKQQTIRGEKVVLFYLPQLTKN